MAIGMKKGLETMAIELLNESKSACNEEALASVAAFAMEKMGIHPESDLSITLVDEKRIEELHIQWMDLPGPTDVLSFPMDELKPDLERSFCKSEIHFAIPSSSVFEFH